MQKLLKFGIEENNIFLPYNVRNLLKVLIRSGKMAMKDITDKQVCEAYLESQKQRGPEWENDYVFPYEVLARMTGESEDDCYIAMERTADKDLVEYGVSLRTGCLTRKGKELIGIIEIPDNGLKWADVQ
jgi:hypothetical protein